MCFRVSVTYVHRPSQLILDITLCGDWAGVPAVYNATCSGGTTGLCVSSSTHSEYERLTRRVRSTPITSLVRVVPAMTMPTLRSTLFACTLSMDFPRPFQVLCATSAPAPAVHLILLRAPALTVDRTPVLRSISRIRSLCFSCCALVLSLFLSKVIDT